MYNLPKNTFSKKKIIIIIYKLSIVKKFFFFLEGREEVNMSKTSSH